MKFQTPKVYAQPGESLEFTGFDKSYEQENMPRLVAQGWPVNWNYVTKDNICPVCVGLVQRTLNVDIPAFCEQSRDTVAQIRAKAREVFLRNSNLSQENPEIRSSKA